MEATLQTENKMGTMSVGRLLANMALPMVASMLVQALYNVVDSIYVSQVSENALTAVSMAYPIQNLMIGFSTGVGVGMNSLLSKCLGSKEHDRGNRAAGNGLVLSAVCCVLFMLFGVFGAGLFFRVQTDIPEIYNGGVQYLQICTLFSFGLFGEILFERLLQATGRTMYTMITQGIGAVLNIILDPLFIFGGLGIPAMGVAGAAVATVIGQIVAFFLALLFHLRKNPEVTLSRQSMRLHWDVLKPILSVGIPSIVMVAIGSVMNFTMNQILVGFTSTAVAVFGAYFKLQSFIFMPVFGLTNAMVPIVAYNFGARKPARIQKCIVLSCICAFLFMLCGFAVFQITPELLLAMFHPTDTFSLHGQSGASDHQLGLPHCQLLRRPQRGISGVGDRPVRYHRLPGQTVVGPAACSLPPVPVQPAGAGVVVVPSGRTGLHHRDAFLLLPGLPEKAAPHFGGFRLRHSRPALTLLLFFSNFTWI